MVNDLIGFRKTFPWLAGELCALDDHGNGRIG